MVSGMTAKMEGRKKIAAECDKKETFWTHQKEAEDKRWNLDHTNFHAVLT